MEILVRYHAPIDRIEKIKVGDWIDLRAAKDTFIEVGECKLIPLGVSMQLPEGYEAHIVPRSSTFMSYGIIMTNSVGIIDNSYCGDTDIWQFPAYCIKPNYTTATGKLGSVIKRNSRICQFRIMKKQPDDLEFIEVDRLTGKARGGFGSTGQV